MTDCTVPLRTVERTEIKLNVFDYPHVAMYTFQQCLLRDCTPQALKLDWFTTDILLYFNFIQAVEVLEEGL